MTSITVDVNHLTDYVAKLFAHEGVPLEGAHRVAQALVAADLDGVSSHGVMLVPMYLARLRAGSVKARAEAEIVEDHGALVVMRAHHMLGQLSAHAAVDLAVQRARQHGVSLVVVREAFHLGAAAYWARACAEQGMVGIVMTNTRPLMPAPGGAERVVGNNPLAIAFPSEAGRPLVTDMATSASAMGKIRLAQAAGQQIPEGWATDAHGRSTTSPAQAIAGMLLPAAGPKGFGLAVAIDLLTGGLSGGGTGAEVQPLYGDLAVPYNCAHMFLVIDAARLSGGAGIGAAVDALANSIRTSARAEGIVNIFAPGDLEAKRRAQAQGRCALSGDTLVSLNDHGAQAGLPQLHF